MIPSFTSIQNFRHKSHSLDSFSFIAMSFVDIRLQWQILNSFLVLAESLLPEVKNITRPHGTLWIVKMFWLRMFGVGHSSDLLFWESKKEFWVCRIGLLWVSGITNTWL